MLELNVQPGIVAAGIFVFFELITLSLLDASLSRIAVSQYYRRIYRGEPIRIESADVLGVTTNLVGSRLDAVNVVIFLVKLCVVIIVFNINGEIEIIPAKSNTMYSFAFNTTTPRFGTDPTLTRKWSEVRRCSTKNQDEITYYRLGFNLQNGTEAPENPEIFPKFASAFNISDATVRCLSPSFVREHQHLVKISGCSTLGTYNCNHDAPFIRNYNYSERGRIKSRTYGSVRSVTSVLKKILVYVTEYDTAKLTEIWPEYSNITLICLKSLLEHSERTSARYNPCLLTSNDGSTTTVEQWILHDHDNSLSFTRYYPGPVFEGNIVLYREQLLPVLLNLVSKMNWEALSALVVSHSLKFERKPYSFTSTRGRGVTVISSFSIYCAAATVFLTVTTSIIVRFTIGRDRRPQFNTINGLSSILREELERNGKCFETGRGVTLEVNDGYLSWKTPGLIPDTEWLYKDYRCLMEEHRMSVNLGSYPPCSDDCRSLL